MTPKIAIIGAGPGGCMLARLLGQSGVEVSLTVFEGEAAMDYRSQGGSLDLRTNTGLAAIKKAGLWNEFQKQARYDGESLLITDKDLITWMKRSGRHSGDSGKAQLMEAPEIDRPILRRMLVESLDASSIRWGHKLSRVEEAPAGLRLHFANGETIDGFDLVVGCDGAFSKTRALLTSERPFYTGLGGWAMSIPNASITAPEINKLANRGSVFAYSDGTNLGIQQVSGDKIEVSCYSQCPENYTKTCGFDINNIYQVKSALKKQLHDWRPELVGAIDKAQNDLAWRNLYQLPVGFTWPHKPGITLLGDAAHLMTPFAGIGVNSAFHDAMLLSGQIIAYTQSLLATSTNSKSHTDALDQYIKQYEQDMFTHAHKAQQLTEASKIHMLFTPGAPRASIHRWVYGHAKEELPWWSHGLVKGVVYAGFWVYKLFV
ncbi:hypothetical protein ACN47E_006139 [Coniothyrium glycines]